jgi:hypothetical protein
VLVVAACHKPPARRADVAADALWQLAPDGTEFGLVATPHAIAMLARTAAALHALSQLPDFAPARGAIDGLLTGVLGAPGASFADAGLATDRGFALFVTPDGSVAVLPVADRARFLASKHGQRGDGTDELRGRPCRVVRGAYVCATSEAMFARLGAGALRGKAALAGPRGDVELFAPDVSLLGGARGDLAATARLAPGTIDLDARWTGTPAGPLAPLDGARAPRPDLAGAAGFVALDLTPLVGLAPPVPLAGGVTLAQLAASLRGPVTIVVPAGTMDPQLRAPLADLGPARSVIDHCAELAGLAASTPQPGTCHVELDGLALDAWLDGDALRIAAHRGPAPAGRTDAVTAAGAALARGDWSAVVWGRGTLLVPPKDEASGVALLGDAALGVHAMALVDELGAGVAVDRDGVRLHAVARTVWANPPEVVAKLVAISTDDVRAGRAAAEVRALATASPGSPFTADLAAGQGGLVFPALVFGTAAELAWPALGAYLRGAPAEADTAGAPPAADAAHPAAEAAPPAADAAAARTAALLVRAYADQAFPAWAAAHPGAACPASIDELASYLHVPAGLPTGTDPWRRPFVLLCGADLPAGARGVAVLSLGPDGRRNTADDIRSW